MNQARIWASVLSVIIAISVMIPVQSVVTNPHESESTDWLSGWIYRKPHLIVGSTTGTQYNYQIMFSVRFGNGFDNSGEVFMNGKCRPDFGDVRFTDSSGANELNYWIFQEINNVAAIFWVKVNYIPANPDNALIYVYYGNPDATTTSNKQWTFDLADDFEDGTNQDWMHSWVSYTARDGTSSYSYEGNYSRLSERTYGSNGGCGNGDFYERLFKTVYVPSGTHLLQGAAAFCYQDSYRTPIEMKLYANSILLTSTSSPGTSWHWLSGDFTLTAGILLELAFEFHLHTQDNLWTGNEAYLIDCVWLRNWCDPEPANGSWGFEQISSDNTPPQIFLVAWISTAPYPLVKSETSAPRKWEPVLVMANVNDEVGGSGLDYVGLCYRVNGGEWWNVTMSFNATSGFWNTIVPGQPENSTVEFFVLAADNSGNSAASGIDSYTVRVIPMGDINGDGSVNIIDIVIVALHYGEAVP